MPIFVGFSLSAGSSGHNTVITY